MTLARARARVPGTLEIEKRAADDCRKRRPHVSPFRALYGEGGTSAEYYWRDLTRMPCLLGDSVYRVPRDAEEDFLVALRENGMMVVVVVVVVT